MRRVAGILLGLALVPALLCDAASAHTRSVSYSTWEIDGEEARVLLRVPQLELTRLPWGAVVPPRLEPGLARYVAETLVLSSGGRRCPVTRPPRLLRAPPERALFEWTVRCSSPGERAIETGFLLDVASSHLHFARLRGGASAATERVLSSSEPRWDLASPQAAREREPQGSSVLTYLLLGIQHIATGYDHLVFLLALLLLAGRVSEVATIVTGFTVAHSITLGLAALGRVTPDSAAIEALIGASIALVAIENAWLLGGRPRVLPWLVAAVLASLALAAAAGSGAVPPLTLAGLAVFVPCYFGLENRVEKPVRLRFAIAFCFGLIHGFGFAGVLAEIALPQGRLLSALLGFNLGVELGQLAIVALVWPVLRWLADLRRGGWHRAVVETGTAVVCGLGLFWFVGRAYGS